MQKWYRSIAVVELAARQTRWVHRLMHLMHRVVTSEILLRWDWAVELVRERLSVITWPVDDAWPLSVDQAEEGRLKALPRSSTSVLNVDVSSVTASCWWHIWWHTAANVHFLVDSPAARSASDRARRVTTTSASTRTLVPTSAASAASASSWRPFYGYTWPGCTAVASLRTVVTSAAASLSWSEDYGRTSGPSTRRTGRMLATFARSGLKAGSSWRGTRETCTVRRSRCTARSVIEPSRRPATCGLTWELTPAKGPTSATSVAWDSLTPVHSRAIGRPTTNPLHISVLQRLNVTRRWMCLVGWHSVLLLALSKPPTLYTLCYSFVVIMNLWVTRVLSIFGFLYLVGNLELGR